MAAPAGNTCAIKPVTGPFPSGPVIGHLSPTIVAMAEQPNPVINRRCDEMRRLLASIEEDVESLRMNPDNAKSLEVHITHLRREVDAVRRERAEIR